MSLWSRLFSKSKDELQLEDRLSCVSQENLKTSQRSHVTALETAEKTEGVKHLMEQMLHAMSNRRKGSDEVTHIK